MQKIFIEIFFFERAIRKALTRKSSSFFIKILLLSSYFSFHACIYFYMYPKPSFLILRPKLRLEKKIKFYGPGQHPHEAKLGW